MAETILDSTVANGTTYYYTVKAINSQGIEGTVGTQSNGATPLASTQPTPDIKWVQSVSSINDYSLSGSLTIDASYGNTLICALTVSADNSNTTGNRNNAVAYLSDTKSNVWTKVADVFGTKNVVVFVATNVAAGKTTINAPTGSAYLAMTMMCQEFSGILDSNALDITPVVSSETGYSATHDIGPSAATTVAKELIVHVYGSANTTATFTAGSGFSNLRTQLGPGYYLQTTMQSKVVTTTGTQSATLTSSEADQGDSVLFSLKVGNPPTAPLTPPGVKATSGNQAATISWGNVANASSYNVYKSSTLNGTYVKLNSTPITGLYYLDSGLVNGVNYYYKVTAVNAVGESAQSSTYTAVPAVPAPSPTYAWHPFGTQPNLTVTQMRTMNRAAYDAWFGYTKTGTGMPSGMPTGALRCKVPDQGFYLNPDYNGTVSEGQGYSMLLKAFFSDPNLGAGIYDPNAKLDFDNYFRYMNFFRDGHDMMHWNIKYNGQVADTGSATDGDYDIAMSLVIMSRLYGDTGAINYGAEAYRYITAISTWDFVPATGVPGTGLYPNRQTNGDQWGFATNSQMSDYLRAAWLREFSAFCFSYGDNTQGARWLDILDANYEGLIRYYNDNYSGGVVPDRQTREYGTIDTPNNDKATYNSVRLGFGLSADILWNGPDVAPALCYSMMNKMANKSKALNGTGSNVKAPNYSLEGVSEQGYPNGSGYGMVGPAALINPANQTFATEVFNAISSSPDLSSNYFNGGVALMAMTVMSGIAQPHRAAGQSQPLEGYTGIYSGSTATTLTRKIGLTGSTTLSTSETAQRLTATVALAGFTSITTNTSLSFSGTVIGVSGACFLATGATASAQATRGLVGTTGALTIVSANTGGNIALTGSTKITTGDKADMSSSTDKLNLVYNPSMEGGDQSGQQGYWSSVRTPSQEEAHTGTWSWKVVTFDSTHGSGICIQVGVNESFVPGEYVYSRTWVKGIAGLKLAAKSRWTNAGGSTYLGENAGGTINFVCTGEWQEVVMPVWTYTGQAFRPQLAIIQQDIGVTNQVFYVDDTIISRMPATYFSGDTGPHTYWTGGPNLSSSVQVYSPVDLAGSTGISTGNAASIGINKGLQGTSAITIASSARVKLQTDAINLLANPSFEYGTFNAGLNGVTQYNANSGLIQDSSEHYLGNYSAKVTNTTGADSGVMVRVANGYALPAGTIVKVGCFIKAPVGIAFFIGDRLSDSAGGYLTQSRTTRNYTGTGDWQRVELPTYTWTDTSADYLPGFYIRFNGAAQTTVNAAFWIDAAYITTSVNSTYFDGDTGPNTYWLGTPHQSQSVMELSSVALTGSTSLISVADATAAGRIPMSGATSLKMSNNATETSVVSLAGATKMTTGVSGQSGTNYALASTAQINTSDSADVSRNIGLVTSTSLTTLATQNVGVSKPLVGSAALSVGITFALSYNALLSGSTTVQTGAIDSISGNLGLTGSAGLSIGVTGDLSVKYAISGSASITTTTFISTEKLVGLDGTSSITTSTVNDLSAARPLIGSSSFTTGVTASSNLLKGVVTSTSITTSGTGTMRIAITLVGYTQIVSAASITMAVLRSLVGKIDTVFGDSASIDKGILKDINVFFERPEDRLFADQPVVRLIVELSIGRRARR